MFTKIFNKDLSINIIGCHEISSLSVEPYEGESLTVIVFEIQKSEIPTFLERELGCRFLAHACPSLVDGKPPHLAQIWRSPLKPRSKDTYFKLYGQFNIDKIWRDDILPSRAYLRHCVLAAKNLGEEAYNNFLDHTFLGDRKTTIRGYLAIAGAGIMEEEPPKSLTTRYGG
ncbi:hypothetical protein UlMin_044637 [Ulmus minor]